MGYITAFLAAITAGFNVWRQERALRNSPEMIKNQLDTSRQLAIDALNRADAVAADPTATPEQHAEALRTIRLAHS